MEPQKKRNLVRYVLGCLTGGMFASGCSLTYSDKINLYPEGILFLGLIASVGMLFVAVGSDSDEQREEEELEKYDYTYRRFVEYQIEELEEENEELRRRDTEEFRRMVDGGESENT